jgi:isopentenyl-diphosphate delta-isomerase
MTPEEPLLICVDDDDAIVGYETKDRCHDGEGILHRAFSVYLFDEGGRLLLQRRSLEKRLWPGFWSNSCCSHPYRGEDPLPAAERRLGEELGLSASLSRAFMYRYQATFEGRGAENELCRVFVGSCSGEIEADPGEVLEWQFLERAKVDEWMRRTPENLTPWFKIAWQRVAADFLPG